MDSASMQQENSVFPLHLYIPIILSVFLIFTYDYNFLLFHTLAELFAIFIAILMGLVAWKTYPFSQNNFLMYLGCGYVWVGVIDLFHAFTFKGLGFFPAESMNPAVQFWVASRYMEAVILITAPYFLTRNLHQSLTFSIYGAVSVVLVATIVSGTFPDAYLSDKGITAFKLLSEYLIVAILGGAIYYLHREHSRIEPNIYKLMIASIVLTMLAELCFTQYATVFDVAVLVGHIFKLFSFWLVFIAIIQTSLTEPFLIMARDSHTYDAIPESVIVVDKKGIIRTANKAACVVTGMLEHKLIGHHCHSIFHANQIAVKDCPICQLISNSESIASFEYKMADENSWSEVALSPINSSSGLQGMVHVSRDITDRKLVENELKEHRENLEELIAERTLKLEHANKELASFSYSASHDLRAPLRGIDGFSLALLEDYSDKLDDVAKDYLRRIRSGSQRMSQLIDDMLILSRITRKDVSERMVDLSKMVDEVAAELQESPEKSRAPVEMVIAEKLKIFSDPALLRILLTNLIDNAFKYSSKEDHPHVEFGSEMKEGKTVYFISDNGVGFDMQNEKKVFEPFQRLHKENEFPGTGIGLATVQRIINRLGGSLWVESKIGAGTTFYFSFV